MTAMELETLAREVGHALKSMSSSWPPPNLAPAVGRRSSLPRWPAAPEWFDRGFVTYTNVSKREMLGVKTTTLSRFGAVSEQTAREMADGAIAHSHAQAALAITGIAGPGGGTPEKPVGTVCFAWAGKKRATKSVKHHFTGDREAVRRQSIAVALQGLLEFLR